MRDDREQFGPLGQKVEKPAQPKPEWVKTDTPGIERNQQGQLRHVPNPSPEPPFTPYYGNPTTWGAAIEALRRGR